MTKSTERDKDIENWAEGKVAFSTNMRVEKDNTIIVSDEYYRATKPADLKGQVKKFKEAQEKEVEKKQEK